VARADGFGLSKLDTKLEQINGEQDDETSNLDFDLLFDHFNIWTECASSESVERKFFRANVGFS
jgi:hypothetical protein